MEEAIAGFFVRHSRAGAIGGVCNAQARMIAALHVAQKAR